MKDSILDHSNLELLQRNRRRLTSQQRQLLDIWEDSRKTVVFVTHDLAEAVTLASRVVVFSGRPGRIKMIETVDIPYPRDPFRIRFLRAGTLSSCRSGRGRSRPSFR